MILDLFVTTVKEYKRFAKQLPLKSNDCMDSFEESIYIAAQVRLMLLRKYISIGDAVYFEKLINEAEKIFSQEVAYLHEMKDRFLQIDQQSFKHILSDGTTLNLRESIDDVVYGLYLHADKNRIDRLSHTYKEFRDYFTKQYVSEIENIIFELYDFLIDKNILDIREEEHLVAPIIMLGNPNESSQDIKKSPYWKNLYGHDATDEETSLIISKLSADERDILIQALRFWEELMKENYSIEKLRGMVFEPIWEQWDDFSEVASCLKKIPNCGISCTVRFNDERYAAYVRILPHIDSEFIVNVPQQISNILHITFFKNPIDKKASWKIFALGDRTDPLKKGIS
jgi:hypothetical protein